MLDIHYCLNAPACISEVVDDDLIGANTWTEAQTSCFKTQVHYLLDEQLLVSTTELAKASRAPRIEIVDAAEPFRIDVFTDMQEVLLLDPIHDARVDAGWQHKS
jgi:hypothetical protein